MNISPVRPWGSETNWPAQVQWYNQKPQTIHISLLFFHVDYKMLNFQIWLDKNRDQKGQGHWKPMSPLPPQALAQPIGVSCPVSLPVRTREVAVADRNKSKSLYQWLIIWPPQHDFLLILFPPWPWKADSLVLSVFSASYLLFMMCLWTHRLPYLSLPTEVKGQETLSNITREASRNPETLAC